MRYQSVEYIMDQLDIEVFSVSDVGNNQGLSDIYDRRAASGDLSGFEPQKDFRCTPKEALKGAKTVIAIAVPYGIKNRWTSGTPRGFVTNMAWEFDYHNVVKNKLDQIKEALLQNHPDANFLTAVDTGPINDRMTAYGSGLGWIGRNQFIIDERVGSGFYIGLIISDFKVEGAKPWRENFESKCGNCRKCQSSCPANALTGEYDFHGQRCISSLTQFKRDLTYDERYRIGRNLYGCDICQWACPHNNQVSKIPEDLTRRTINTVDPFEILGHSNKSFKREYGHMGFAWRGLKIYKRNALIVIGNDRQAKDFDRVRDMLLSLPSGLESYGLYAMMMISPQKTKDYLEDKALKQKRSNSVPSENITIKVENTEADHKNNDKAVKNEIQCLLDEFKLIEEWMRYKFRNLDTSEKEKWLIKK
ncbi:tRNA epoxyqueuosine(34) reductase QueG [Fusibacter sp. JL216-2]|uniref:tRNA epoxyqueuosine(34) reductase QueG n=1 Tax=Fusibacter sp. JL216-2 TaxID=3071453 RepID=UPI003D329DC4